MATSGFLYCLNSSTIRPTPILEKIRVAKQAGYSAIELWHDDIEAHCQQGGTIAEIRHAVDDAGLEVPTTIYLRNWFDAHGTALEEAWDEARQRMEIAAQLGAKYVIASPPGGKADYVDGARRYRKLLEMGEQIGVKPSMEFLGFVDDLNTIEKALLVMNGAQHPSATTILDPFHIYRGGGGVESVAKLQDSQIAISHFNDVVESPPRKEQHDRDRVMPGDGCFDLKRYLQLLRGTGYRRWLSLELFREDLWARNPLDVAREGIEKMRAVAESS